MLVARWFEILGDSQVKLETRLCIGSAAGRKRQAPPDRAVAAPMKLVLGPASPGTDQPES